MDLKQKELMQERLRTARIKAGQTQKQAGESINVNGGTIGNYETGKRLPSIEIICDLSRKYNVEVGYLLGMEDNSIDAYIPADTKAIQLKYLIKGRFLDLADLSDARKFELIEYYQFLKMKEMRTQREKAPTKK